MKVIIVGGVAGGASCAARLRRLDEKAEILMVERGPYVSYANCGLPYHVSGVIPEESSLLVATEQMFRAVFSDRRPDELRGDRHRPEEEDGGPARRQDRQGHDRVLRQAGAVAWRGPDPPAAARHRPSRDLLGADRPGRPDHPRVAAPRRGDEDRDGLVHRAPGRHEAEAGGGGRRRVHRPRDGRELRPPRPRGDPRREAEPGHAAARPGDVAPRRALPRQARREPPARRRRRRLPAGRGRLARGPHRVREGPPGGRRDPRDRRAAGDGAREGGRPRDRPARAASASTST